MNVALLPLMVVVNFEPNAIAWKSSTNNCNTADFTLIPFSGQSKVIACGFLSGLLVLDEYPSLLLLAPDPTIIRSVPAASAGLIFQGKP